MKLKVELVNELPFMLEIADGLYEIKVGSGIVKVNVSSEYFNLYKSPFARNSDGLYAYGSKETLEGIVLEYNLSCYAFQKSKTYVEMTFEEEYVINKLEIDKVTDEQVKNDIKSTLIVKGFEYKEIIELDVKTNEEFDSLTEDMLEQLKRKVLTHKRLNKLCNIEIYYEALNKLIDIYSHTRKLFWISKLNENTLEGTMMLKFINNKLVENIKYAGLVPSAVPNRRLFPDMSEQENKVFCDKLKTEYIVPLEEQLIITAKSLWYRCEYRSAIIEISSALEIAVEKKIIEKMKGLQKTDQEIEAELDKTIVNFPQRCDAFLKRYTGFSFVKDNSTLWTKIDDYRKNYRHKIVHSNLVPTKEEVDTILKDFEQAIMYVINL